MSVSLCSNTHKNERGMKRVKISLRVLKITETVKILLKM